MCVCVCADSNNTIGTRSTRCNREVGNDEINNDTRVLRECESANIPIHRGFVNSSPARPPASSPLSPAASHTHSGVRVVVRFVYQSAHPSRLSERRRDDLFNKLTYTFISHPFPPRPARVRIITALTVRCGAHPSHAPTPPHPHPIPVAILIHSAPLLCGLAFSLTHLARQRVRLIRHKFS